MFKDEKVIIAIAKTLGHRKNCKVIESLPLDWSIKVHNCADHFRSEISSSALVTFHDIEKHENNELF